MKTTVVALFALAAAVPTASAAISYNGGLESGGYQPWSLQYEEDRPIGDSFSLVTDNVRQGKYAGKMTVRQGYSDFGYHEDTELEWDSNESEGSDYYYAWSTMFPTDWVAPNGWGIFLQWHNHLGTPPPLSFDARGNSAYVHVRAGNTDVSRSAFEYDKQIEFLPTLSKGKWNDFVVHVHWAAGNTGSVEVSHRVEGASAFTKLVTLRTSRRSSAPRPRAPTRTTRCGASTAAATARSQRSSAARARRASRPTA